MWRRQIQRLLRERILAESLLHCLKSQAEVSQQSHVEHYSVQLAEKQAGYSEGRRLCRALLLILVLVCSPGFWPC